MVVLENMAIPQKMLYQVIAGAKSVGAETELVNLFDLDYNGCISCYACKLKIVSLLDIVW